MRKNMMKRNIVFVLSVVFVSIACLPADAVVITPSNVVIPEFPGETFSFDFIIDDPMGVTAESYQSTITVSGPGGLSFNTAASQAVATDADYWVFDNSAGASAFVKTATNSFVFSDSPSNPEAETLLADDIMARYAFIWDGSAQGDYTFNLRLGERVSFVKNSITSSREALQFTPGQYPGDDNSFTVHLPEPASVILLVLGGAFLIKPRA